MLAKMIDKIVSLKETKIFEIDGQTYADASLTRIPPHVDRPDCISVSGLDSICKLIRTELEKVGTTIMVQVKSNDTVEVMTTYLSDFSRNTLYRAKADAPGLRTGFRGREVALIELRSLCIPNEGTAYLLDLLSRMTNENSVSTNDNGVTQTVEARQGVALNALIEIKPRVMLRPFRTFLEVEQPESEFLLRVDPDEGIGFFEADGGIWKLEAKKNIADYFLCRRSEATKLLEKAKTEAAEILKELKAFYTGDIGITAYINRHVMGCSVAGDLTINGEICRSYDPIDLCFLELNELMMKRLIESRKEDDPNGKG